jgi:hypothetical protein
VTANPNVKGFIEQAEARFKARHATAAGTDAFRRVKELYGQVPNQARKAIDDARQRLRTTLREDVGKRPIEVPPKKK